MKSEWIAVDFSYYSILATVLHSNPDSARGLFIRKECLSYARKALTSLRNMQQTMITDGHVPETHPYFLT